MLIPGKLYRLNTDNPTTTECHYILTKSGSGYKTHQNEKYICINMESTFIYLCQSNVEYRELFIRTSLIFLYGNSLFGTEIKDVNQYVNTR